MVSRGGLDVELDTSQVDRVEQYSRYQSRYRRRRLGRLRHHCRCRCVVLLVAPTDSEAGADGDGRAVRVTGVQITDLKVATVVDGGTVDVVTVG